MISIYIAGKISGECETPELLRNCCMKFDFYAKWNLRQDDSFFKDIWIFDKERKFTHGLRINSALIRSGKGTYELYMRNDISRMLLCDEVHFLEDWQDSNGAKYEHEIATRLKMKIVYE